MGKPPEKVKQVKEAKVFFAEVDKLRRAADSGNKKAAAVSYAAAKEALEIFLNDVELPPTSFPDYKQTADVSVPSARAPSASDRVRHRISFCIWSATAARRWRRRRRRHDSRSGGWGGERAILDTSSVKCTCCRA